MPRVIQVIEEVVQLAPAADGSAIRMRRYWNMEGTLLLAEVHPQKEALWAEYLESLRPAQGGSPEEGIVELDPDGAAD